MFEPPNVSAVAIAGGKILTSYVTSFSGVHSRVAVTVLTPKNSVILATTFDGAA